MVLLIGGRWVYERVDENLQRRPLEAVERAAIAADKPIAVISPSLVEKWDAGSKAPTEATVRDLVGAGNVYLEPIFYFLRGRGDSFDPGDRCYFFPVQRGQTFDAEKVSAVTRVCYSDGFRTPQSGSTIAVSP